MGEQNFNQVTIIIAEDDDGHADLIMEHLEEVGIVNPMLRFQDGQEVLNYFFNDDQTSRQEGQYLILLDINMPKIDGIEVLKRIKQDKFYQKLPVIMLTTTDERREIETCHELGCNCYIVKPVKFSDFAQTLHRLGLFLMVVSIPTINYS